MRLKPKMVRVELTEPVVFEWDTGNMSKNLIKHNVSPEEAEQAFSGKNKQIFFDKNHSTNKEKRFILIGLTKNGRILYIVFTLRKTKVRVISVRDLNKKEGYLHEKES